jgi:hypothetical protein
MRLSREATQAEIYLFASSRDVNKCCFSGCYGERHSHTACDDHMEEFEAQRDIGIFDFRLWALYKMGLLYPTGDAFATYERLRLEDP